MYINSLDPVIFELLGLQVRWYGIVYALGFLSLYFFLSILVKHKAIPNFEKEDVEPFLIGLIKHYVMDGLFLVPNVLLSSLLFDDSNLVLL